MVTILNTLKLKNVFTVQDKRLTTEITSQLTITSLCSVPTLAFSEIFYSQNCNLKPKEETIQVCFLTINFTILCKQEHMSMRFAGRQLETIYLQLTLTIISLQPCELNAHAPA